MTNPHALTLAPRILWEERGPLWVGKSTAPLSGDVLDFQVAELASGAGFIGRYLGDLSAVIPIQATAAQARHACQRFADARALSRLSTPALACLIDILSSYAEGNEDHFLRALQTCRDVLFERHHEMTKRGVT